MGLNQFCLRTLSLEKAALTKAGFHPMFFLLANALI